MKIGMVGLGRMGGNMTRRLLEYGHQVVAFDHNPATVEGAVADGAKGASGLEEVVAQLEPPRSVWLMVPAGEPTRATIERLSELLEAGDTVVDGGNSHYRDSQQAAARLEERGVAFLDTGVSGGVWGLKYGYCLMVGGDAEAAARLEPVFTALAGPGAYARVGPSGAGHYTKMIHNGIEYGMLQAYAEGFALLDAAPELELDLHRVATLWNHGSVVRSWLLELAELALSEPAEFSKIRGYVEDSGEGRWTVQEGIERAVAVPVITSSLFARFSSRQPDSFAARIVAALRNQFGGHKFLTEAPAAEAAERAAGGGPETARPVAAGPETAATAATDRPE